MKFGQSLKRGDAQKLRSLRKELRVNFKFKDLPDGECFKVGNSTKVYKKIGNSHSESCSGGKDAIFSLNARVHKVAHP